MKFSGSLFFCMKYLSVQNKVSKNKINSVRSVLAKIDVAEMGYHKSVLHLSNFCDTIVVTMKSKYARFVVLSTYDANFV